MMCNWAISSSTEIGWRKALEASKDFNRDRFPETRDFSQDIFLLRSQKLKHLNFSYCNFEQFWDSDKNITLNLGSLHIEKLSIDIKPILSIYKNVNSLEVCGNILLEVCGNNQQQEVEVKQEEVKQELREEVEVKREEVKQELREEEKNNGGDNKHVIYYFDRSNGRKCIWCMDLHSHQNW